MPERFKNAAIGLFIIASIVIIVSIILFLEPSIGDGKEKLNVRFTNVSGVNIGTHVTLAGKAVGEIEEINIVKNSRKGKSDEFGRVYFYQLVLKVDSAVQIYNTDEISIQTTGLLGEKSIAIIPKIAKKGVIPKLITHTIIYGDSIEPLENAIYQLGQLSEKIENMVVEVDNWFVENSDEIAFAVKSFGDAMKEIDQMIASINQNNVICSVKEATDEFTDNMRLFHHSLEEVNEKQIVSKFNTVLENSVDLTQSAKIIAQDIEQGKGTIGKLIKSDDFYLRLTAIMSKVDTLMNDVNHYGVLFQYDKHWQRIRTKRANLLQALDTPQEFKNYFEGEVDGITTALARISILINKAQTEEEKQKILQNNLFKKDFATLLRQVEDMLDTLKLYNEQLVEENPCN
jgi:phospholipid/cholesterol/gamma-HCH transport system substrate-binding protein